MRLDEFSAYPSGSGLTAQERARWVCFGFDLPSGALVVLGATDCAISSLTPKRIFVSLTPRRTITQT